MGSPDAQASVGASLDLGELSLSAILGLQASVNSLAKAFSDWKQQEADYERGVTDVIIQKAETGPETGNLVVGIGGPEPGFMWELRSLTASYVDPSTGSQTGTAYMFHQASRPTTPLPGGNWIDWTGANGATLPAVAFYSSRQVVLHNPDRLWVVFVSPVYNQQYVCSGRALQYPDKVQRAVTAL
jgi:hypothetical protein